MIYLFLLLEKVMCTFKDNLKWVPHYLKSSFLFIILILVGMMNKCILLKKTLLHHQIIYGRLWTKRKNIQIFFWETKYKMCSSAPSGRNYLEAPDSIWWQLLTLKTHLEKETPHLILWSNLFFNVWYSNLWNLWLLFCYQFVICMLSSCQVL